MPGTSKPIAFRKIIVGVDGGPGGRDAIALARQLIDDGGQLTLAHVHDGEEVPARGSNLSYDAVQLADSRRLLDDERAAAGLSGGAVTIASPSVGRGLHTLAAEADADMIVVGSCRRGLLGRVTFGDDARDSLRGADRVVAVAPQGYASAAHTVRVIGVGYDSSDESEAALELARAIAARHRASVRVLTVVTPPLVGYGAPLGIEFAEDDAHERLAALNDVDGHVSIGVAGRELGQFAAEVDLLVVGSHGHGRFGRALSGSTSEHLARIAECPLLVVPQAVVEHGLEVDEQSSVEAPA